MTRNAAIVLLLRTKLRDSVTFCAFEMRQREQLSFCDRRIVQTKIGSEIEKGY
jgi:hypothetical protein